MHAPAATAAAADRDDQDVEVGLPLERLQRVGADSRDQMRLVAGVDVAVAVLARKRLAVLARVIEVVTVEDELRAEALHRGDLHGVRCSGTQMIARTSKIREAKAIDCPWLPSMR